MNMGRVVNPSKRTVVPQHDFTEETPANGEVVNYRLSEDELAKYRALPVDKEQKRVFIIPMKKI